VGALADAGYAKNAFNRNQAAGANKLYLLPEVLL
jgi:hypothetical protein